MLLDDTSDQGWDSSGDHKLPGVHFSDNINGLLIFDDRCTVVPPTLICQLNFLFLLVYCIYFIVLLFYFIIEMTMFSVTF